MRIMHTYKTYAEVPPNICICDCVSVGVCMHSYPCVWSFHYLILPYTGHLIAHDSSSQMLKSYSPSVSEIPICDKSVALSASWPHEHFFFPSHFFPTLTDRIDWLCQSYCENFVLWEVPEFIAINHGDADIHTCSTAGSLVPRTFSNE